MARMAASIWLALVFAMVNGILTSVVEEVSEVDTMGAR